MLTVEQIEAEIAHIQNQLKQNQDNAILLNGALQAYTLMKDKASHVEKSEAKTQIVEAEIIPPKKKSK